MLPGKKGIEWRREGRGGKEDAKNIKRIFLIKYYAY